MDNKQHTFNNIIVLINGNIVNNETLKINIDNLVILHKNKYINRKLTEYINHLKMVYYRKPSEKAVDYLESEIIQELSHDGKINKVVNKLKTAGNPNDSINKLRQLRDKLNGKTPKPKLEIPKHIINKSILEYSDIKPYLTHKQLRLVSETAEKRNIDYETKLLTMDFDLFNKEFEKVKNDYTTKYLGNKHIKTKIGLVYRLFTEIKELNYL